MRGAARFASIFVPAGLVLILIIIGFYERDLGVARKQEAHDASLVTARWADEIASEIRSVRSDVAYLAEQRATVDYATSGGERERALLAEEFRLFCARRGLYDQIRYLDASGWEKIRVNLKDGAPEVVADAALQFKGDRYYFEKILDRARGETYVSPFDLNVEHDRVETPWKPMIRFGTPVFDANGAKRGVLALNYLGARLLRNLDQAAATSAGRMFLVDRDGNVLHGGEDDWGFMFGRRPAFPAAHSEAWAAIGRARSGQVALDQGLVTFESVGPGADAPERELAVVSVVPEATISGRSRAFLRRLLAVSASAMTALAVLAALLARASEKRARAQEKLRELSKRLLTAEEEERKSISRDLHDDLGQVLTALCLDVEAACRLEGTRRDEALARARTTARDALQRLHGIAARLRPPLLDDLGLREAVRGALADFESRAGVEVRAALDVERSLPAEVSDGLYRILQEALTNIEKHARAERVHVDLRLQGETAQLTVRDEGAGFVIGAGQGLGLLGMRERAELLGGTFQVESAPREGTSVTVTVPTAGGSS